MPANLENSAVATRLEKVSFHFNPKEGQCQRMFKLPYSCTHFIAQQGNAQNPSSQVSMVYEWRTSRSKLYFKKAEETEIKLPTSTGSQKKHESSRKTSISALLTMPKSLTVWITINWKILKEMQIPGRIYPAS